MNGPEIKKDFTDELQIAIPESIALADSVGLDEAINFLLGLERKCRTNGDFTNLKEVCLHMVRLCRQRADWDKLNATLIVLNKRRSQSKVAITAIVNEALTYVDDTPTKTTRIELIKTLMDVCEAKIYVEAEGARLHLMLAHMYEEDGDLALACDAIQDVHVETYGSLTKKEKAEYILQQVRLNLLRGDLVRTMIQSRKMNRKTLEEAGFEEIKIKFYEQMIQYHTHDKDVWEISQCYYKVYDTSITKTNPETLKSSLQSCVLFALLSAHNNHQEDFLHRLLLLKDILESPALHKALTLFTTKEIMSVPFPDQDSITNIPALERGGKEATAYFLELLTSRIIQHNIRVVAGYYSRIRIARLGELLGLSSEQTEARLSEMVANDELHVRIDRPSGIANFTRDRTPDELLSGWASDVGRMLHLMESTCHLINRENMVHKL